MTQKILIAYFTKVGASKEYATIIADNLTSDGYLVDIYDLAHSQPDLAPYDIVILGTGVKINRVYGKWKKILKQPLINTKYLFLFLSSGMAEDEPEKAVGKYLQPIVKKYGLCPKSLISFPGKIPEKWAKYEEKKVTMNPDAARAWAQEIIQIVQQ